MDMIVDVINSIDAFVWGPPMLVLLLGSHIFLTFRTGFIQRKLPTAIKLSVTKDPDAPGDISQFGALCTALSATIGTGNIVGVARPSSRAARARCSGCGSPACSASPRSTPRPSLPLSTA